MGKDKIIITEAGCQQGTEQSITLKQPASPYMDTVEISEEGKVASARLQKQRTDAAITEGHQYEVKNLSEYTDTELKQMYYNGEITR